ncbi:DUF1983 domain-containing protein [bacterium]|nr:DUF1983 domain-containing protein [bacterium]
MADVRISQLDALRDVADDDILIVNDKSDGNKTKITRKKDLLYGISRNITDDGLNAVVNQDLIVNNDILLDGDIRTTGSITFGMLKDYTEGTSVLGFTNDAQSILTLDSVLPTSKAIRDYVVATLRSSNAVDSSMIVNHINIAYDSFYTLFEQNDSGITVLAERITYLESQLNVIDSDTIMSAMATALDEIRTRIDLTDSGVIVLSEDITALSASLSGYASGISANASALDLLRTRIDQDSDSLSILSEAFDSVRASVDLFDSAFVTSAMAGAIDGIHVRIDNDSDGLAIISSKVANLEASLTEGIDSDLVLQVAGGAINDLTVRINRDSDSLSVLSQEVTALHVSLNDAINDISANGTAISLLRTRIEQDSGRLSILSDAFDSVRASVDLFDSSFVTSAMATAIDGIYTRINNDSDGLAIISGKVTNLEVSLTEGIDSDLVLQVLGGAVEELGTRIDRDSDRLTVESQKIVDLSASYENLADSVSANGNAFNELKTRVDADSDKLSVVSSDITSLSASVNDPTTGLSANASAVSALTATVDNLGNASAVYALDLDVNGHIAGIKLENTGDSSEFIVNADAFRVYNGSTDSAAFSVVDGQVYLGGINVLGANIDDLTVANLEGDVNVITAFKGSAYKTWGPTSAGYKELTEIMLPANSTGMSHVGSVMMSFSGLFATDSLKCKLESRVETGSYSEIQTMSQVTGSGGQALETVTVIGSHPAETSENVYFRISVEMRGNNGTSSTSQSRSSTNVWSGVVMGTVGGISSSFGTGTPAGYDPGSDDNTAGGGGSGGGGNNDGTDIGQN